MHYERVQFEKKGDIEELDKNEFMESNQVMRDWMQKEKTVEDD